MLVSFSKYIYFYEYLLSLYIPFENIEKESKIKQLLSEIIFKI